ncbi:MAG: N-acetylmuramic acid 6-phosphate etherase [Deltaproteobacteria bacterium]|nr:N-acetylmuramic acid 6-phosphate etherase [Deltaproteobacteria bacterium]
MPTETRHEESRELDSLSTDQVVALLLEEDRRGLEAASAQGKAIAQAAEWVAEGLAKGGDLILVGAGTSGRLGVLEAAECPPTFGTDPRRIRAVMAGGREAVFRSREGAEDRREDGREVVADLVAKDVLISISASSVTPFAHGALESARERGARTVLLTCAAARKELEGVADLLLALDTGPEVLAGSTRLKAGSATKAALNAITTAAMVRLGKVFEGYMVDLSPGSEKLRDRAVRIVEAAGRVSPEVARELLSATGGEVKTAIVMGRRGQSAEAARGRLEQSAGNVRRALEKSGSV